MDYESASRRFRNSLHKAQKDQLLGGDYKDTVDTTTNRRMDVVFDSRTQAFREALVGCVLARIYDPDIDATLPYTQHGDRSYSGRSMDERAVNPVLQELSVPSSKGPFLSVFRRSVTFTQNTARGVRDRAAYAAFVELVRHVNSANDGTLLAFLDELSYRFINLRERASVRLLKLGRISHAQYQHLLELLLSTPSGGRFPMILVDAIFSAIKITFDLDWDITVQGVNVADNTTGATGDIEVRSAGEVILAAEITERRVDENRVRQTFNTKIAVGGIHDYLFLVTTDPDEAALIRARQYFNQGHEVSFADIKTYILATLLSIGRAGRGIFNQILVERLASTDIPAGIKVTWNDAMEQLTE